MPTFLPPRLGISLSDAIAEAFTSAPVDDTWLLTLELHHSSFVDEFGNPTAARVVNDWADLTATLEADAPINASEAVVFKGVPFRYTMPEQTDSGAPNAVTIEIENVSRDLTALLDLAVGSNEAILLIERQYMASDTSGPHILPVTKVYLSNVVVTTTTVQAQASFGNLTNRRFPGARYLRDEFLGLSLS